MHLSKRREAGKNRKKKAGDTLPELQKCALLLLMTLAAVWDIRRGKVPNLLILAGLGLGFLFDLSPAYLLRSLGVMLILFPFSRRRLIGGGDAKLAGVLCGWLGLADGMRCIAFSLLWAGAASLIRILRNPGLRRRFLYLMEYVRQSVTTGQVIPYEGPEREAASFPLAAAMLAGLVTYGLWKGGAMI